MSVSSLLLPSFKWRELRYPLFFCPIPDPLSFWPWWVWLFLVGERDINKIWDESESKWIRKWEKLLCQSITSLAKDIFLFLSRNFCDPLSPCVIGFSKCYFIFFFLEIQKDCIFQPPLKISHNHVMSPGQGARRDSNVMLPTWSIKEYHCLFLLSLPLLKKSGSHESGCWCCEMVELPLAWDPERQCRV